eukprot:1671421-Amphidinium_carterae.1
MLRGVFGSNTRHEGGASEEVFEETMKVLQDIFANKATATLRLRHNSVMKFVNWKRSVSEDLADNTMPVDEQTLYDYVCFLRVAKAAKSIAKNFCGILVVLGRGI